MNSSLLATTVKNLKSEDENLTGKDPTMELNALLKVMTNMINAYSVVHIDPMTANEFKNSVVTVVRDTLIQHVETPVIH